MFLRDGDTGLKLGPCLTLVAPKPATPELDEEFSGGENGQLPACQGSASEPRKSSKDMQQDLCIQQIVVGMASTGSSSLTEKPRVQPEKMAS